MPRAKERPKNSPNVSILVPSRGRGWDCRVQGKITRLRKQRADASNFSCAFLGGFTANHRVSAADESTLVFDTTLMERSAHPPFGVLVWTAATAGAGVVVSLADDWALPVSYLTPAPAIATRVPKDTGS